MGRVGNDDGGTAMSEAGAAELADALEALAEAATAVGLDAAEARHEGAAFAAALAESAPGAAQEWAQVLGLRVADFFDAAVRARRWRAAPTALLSRLVADGADGSGYAKALTEVAASACSLGEPTVRVVANASAAAAAQLAAVREVRDPGTAVRPPGVAGREHHQ